MNAPLLLRASLSPPAADPAADGPGWDFDGRGELLGARADRDYPPLRSLRDFPVHPRDRERLAGVLGRSGEVLLRLRNRRGEYRWTRLASVCTPGSLRLLARDVHREQWLQRCADLRARVLPPADAPGDGAAGIDMLAAALAEFFPGIGCSVLRHDGGEAGPAFGGGLLCGRLRQRDAATPGERPCPCLHDGAEDGPRLHDWSRGGGGCVVAGALGLACCVSVPLLPPGGGPRLGTLSLLVEADGRYAELEGLAGLCASLAGVALAVDGGRRPRVPPAMPASDSCAWWDARADLLVPAREFLDLHGMPGEAARLRLADWLEYILPADRTGVSLQMERALGNGAAALELDYRVRHPHGSRALRMQCSLERDEHGRARRVLFTCRGWSALGEAGDAVAGAPDVLQLLPLITFHADLQGRVVDASGFGALRSALYRSPLTGRHLSEVLGLSVAEVEETLSQARCGLCPPLAGRLATGAGSAEFLVTGFLSLGADGVLRGVLAEMREAPRGERERQQLSQLFHMLVQLPIVFYRVGAAGHLESALGRGLERFRLQDGDCVGRHVDQLFPGIFEALQEQPWGERPVLAREIRGGAGDGGGLYGFANVLIRDAVFGMGWVGFAIDITDRLRAEDELRTLNATLDQRVKQALRENREQQNILIHQSRLAAMGEMVGNIAHQWRQPINALGLLLQNILLDHQFGELDQARLQDHVRKAETLIQRMSGTIDDFRNFFSPGKKPVLFPLDKVVADVLLLMDGSLRNGGIEATSEVPAELQLRGFPNELAQVVLNLVANAKDAIAAAGRRQGRLLIRARAVADGLLMQIEDNGGGVPEEYLERLFRPYFTTRENGTGVGLYMSRMVLQQSFGGEIRYLKGAEGAIFELFLPTEP